MYITTAEHSQAEIYKILIASVAPRPIAWAGTRSKDGINNLAPFSFYNVFGANPPIVGFSTIPKLDGSNKDTLQNIIDTGCFTLSCVSHKLLTQMSKSSALLDADEDEFEFAGLEAAEAKSINAPYVAEALMIFECQLREVINLGDGPGSGNLILGEITHIQIDDDICLENGRIDFETLDPVGRLAGNWYATIRDKVEIQRG
jgi:flavin reductase (DIM6/NTAB) family NADH-FMN oxidoreductase RutF